MREGLIILPQATNNGDDLSWLRDRVVSSLVDRFGGATVRNAVGSWRSDDGEVMREPVWELVTAYEPTPDNREVLRNIAFDLGHSAKQLAVYVRHADGEVEIINTTKH